MSSSITLVSKSKSFGGEVRRYSHTSSSLSCDMKFHVYVPPKSSPTTTACLWFLSGLTCTDENFIQKSGAVKYAAENNIFLVCPDTSPRGIKLENEEEVCWSGPGFGAGYYLDATTESYKTHFRMYSYITDELFKLVNNEFKDLINVNLHSITGHSAGGASIAIGIKTNGQYKSISAFSPISNPMECDWAIKAYKAYLGENRDDWLQYDTCHLIKTYNGINDIEIFVDQGSEDEFLDYLKFDKLKSVASENPKIKLIARLQDGYNHGYFYISTFIKDHIEYHAKHLKN